MARDDLIALKLAHPFPVERCAAIGAEPRNYNPGDTIVVREPYARALINAGMAQVDPGSREQVSRALSKVVGSEPEPEPEPQPKPRRRRAEPEPEPEPEVAVEAEAEVQAEAAAD